MRHLDPDMDRDVVAEIDRRLARVAASEHVTIPWAIESGSRAWGFPSPDSDDDCRFLYVRSLERYASPWPVRDLVETPVDAVFDVGGGIWPRPPDWRCGATRPSVSGSARPWSTAATPPSVTPCSRSSRGWPTGRR